MVQQPFLNHEQSQSLDSVQFVVSKSSSHTICQSQEGDALNAGKKKKTSVASVFTFILEVLLSAIAICFLGAILFLLRAPAKMNLLTEHSPRWPGGLSEG